MDILALPFPAIDPVLLHFGPLVIRWYALAYIAGLVAGWALIRHIVAHDDYWDGQARPSVDSIDDLLVFCALGVVIGGRLGNVLFYDPAYYLAHPLEVFMVWRGGMAFHGGLLGALAGVAWFARQYRAPFLTTLDLVSLAAPIGLFFGRIANFIKPELWGRPTDVPWAVIFPDTDGQPRHPSQLYEAGLEGLVCFALLMLLARSGGLKQPGAIAGAFGLFYGVARIISEFYRDPDPYLENLGAGLTMGMALSAPMVIMGAGLWLFAARRGRP